MTSKSIRVGFSCINCGEDLHWWSDPKAPDIGEQVTAVSAGVYRVNPSVAPWVCGNDGIIRCKCAGSPTLSLLVRRPQDVELTTV